jgi:hypothetical protein
MPNTQTNFIYTSFLEDLKLCDELVQHHKETPFKGPGSLGNVVAEEYKKSIDCYLYPNSKLGGSYLVALQKVVEEYIRQYSFCDHYAPWKCIELINIQHYAPEGGYFTWHTERTNAQLPASVRHLVFMTYLNDVTDGGETEFYYQNLKVQPQKGKTLIWPADWTHTHRGITSATQDKYIITGWFSFL